MSSTSDQVKGALDEAKGKAKRIYGEIADDDQAKAEGSIDKAKGKLEQLKGQVKEKIEKHVDQV